MKKYLSRLLCLVFVSVGISTITISCNVNRDILELYKMRLYQNMLQQYGELNKKDEKKSEKEKKESFFQSTLKQTASLTKKCFKPLLPYAVMGGVGILTLNNLASSVLPASWINRTSLSDIFLSPHVLVLMFLLAQE